MTRGRWFRYAAVGAAVIVVAAAGAAAFLSLQTPYQPPTPLPGTQNCSPKPCADVQGFTLWVRDLKVDSGLVTMQLTFKNSSSATHADPADIELIDSRNHSARPVYDAPGCGQWQRTEFSKGARFGPVSECFRPSTTDPPLSLHWTPDMSMFCCETVIRLE